MSALAARRLAALSLSTLIVAGLYAASPGTAIGTAETRANTTTLLGQTAASVARDADGDYVVVWTSATATDAGDVYFQRYNNKGVAQGSETRVNTTTSGAQVAPAVAMDASGDFVVAWSGNGSQTGQVDTAGVFFQRYNAAGAAQGAETRANTTTANTQELPAVAINADGAFVIAWQSLSQDGSGQGVYAQRYSAAGAAQGSEFAVNTYTTGSQRDPSVGMALDGSFVVVWESNLQDGELNGIYGRMFAADGSEAKAEFILNTVTAGSQDNPVVASTIDGSFVVAWSGPDSAGSASLDVYARRFDAAGAAVGGAEARVNIATTNDQAAPAIAQDALGNYVIAWESNAGASGYDIVARRYTSAGAAGSENEIAINSTTALDQRAPAVAMDADGDAVVAWQGNGTGDTEGVFSRRVTGPEPVDLAIAKDDATDPVTAGGTITYTLTASNLHAEVAPTGNATLDAAIGSAAAVVVTDTLPNGGGDTVTYLTAEGTGWSCSNSSGTVTCTLAGNLAPDSTAEPITVSVAAPASAPADRSVTNTAAISSAQYDAVAANDSTTEDTVVCGIGESAGTLAVTNTAAAESAGTGAVTVTRSGGTCGTVSVDVTIGAGTAATPADFTATSPQTLTWANGETGPKSVATPVTIVNDTVYEVNETVAITLGNVVRATEGANGTLTINDNEAQPTISIADNNAAEGNTGTSSLPLTVTLTPAAGTTVGRTVSARVDTSNGTATTADADYVAITEGTVTFVTGDSTETVNLTVNGDLRNEDNETVNVTLSEPVGATLGDGVAVATINNDDAVPTVAFAAASSSVSETGTGVLQDQPRTATIAVNLSTASSKAVTVTVGATGTATAADYSFTPTTVSFAAGETTKNVTLTVAIDTLDEPDETVVFTLSSPANATLGAQATHTATITDDDATPTVTIGGSATVAESTSSTNFTVSLSAASGRTVTVNYALSGTATSGTDYTTSPAPGTLTIPAGQTSVQIGLTITNDALDENNETVIATLSAPTNATLGSPSAFTTTINDEDATPTVSFTPPSQSVAENVAGGTATATITLSAISGRTVTVPFTVNAAPAQGNDATSGTDFSMGTTSPVTIPAGSTTGTITVNIVNDGANESAELVRLAMDTDNLVGAGAGANTTHVLTITNDDAQPQVGFTAAAQSKSEGAGLATVTVQLSRVADEDVTIDYTLSGTAANGSDYSITPSPILIAQGETTGTLTVTLTNDARVETDETLVITLANAVGATIPAGTSVHTLTIANNDTAGVVLTQSGGSTDVVEGGSTDTYTVVLTSEPASDVTISPTSSGQVTVPATLTFAPSGANAWNVAQTVTVTAVDDMAGEGPHTDTVTHTSSSGDLNYDGLAVGSVPVNITDNDVPALIITQSGGGTTVNENGTTDSYTVALSAMPSQSVTVNLTHDGQVTLSAASLTFTTGNWNTPQPVTVMADDDDVAEGTHTSTVTHASTSSDGQFNALTADVVVQITDNESAGVVLSKTTATATEGGAGDTYTMRLASQPVGDVVVTLTPDAQVSVDETEVIFNAVNWNLDVPIAISAIDDTVDEAATHAGVIAHSVSAASDANYDDVAVASVNVAVADNDLPPGVTLTLTGSPLAEAAGVATVTATLSAASSNNVVVGLGFTGTATNPGDYTRSGTSITIPAGALSRSVTITAVQDPTDEPDETVIVDITTVTNGVETGAQQVTATITDDDSAPTVSLAVTGTPLAEAAGVATFTATLSNATTQAVTVTLGFTGTATNPDDYTRSGTSITIPAGSLNGSVTVTAVQDTADEADETVIVDITAVANATESGTQQRTATITDDDATPPPPADDGGSWSWLSLWLLIPAWLRRRAAVTA